MSKGAGNRGMVITVRLDADTLLQLSDSAKANERTLSQEVRLAIREYLDRKGGKRR